LDIETILGAVAQLGERLNRTQEAGDEAGLKSALQKAFLERTVLDNLRNNAWRSSRDFGCPHHAGRLIGIYRQAIRLNNA